MSFSKELISFSLYGKIPRESKRPWNESLSSKIAQAQSSFKNIPLTLYFSPSSVTFYGVGVYAAITLPKGIRLGPYIGKAVKKEMEEETHEWLWEVYQDSSLAYFIDASDPKYGNWMNFIQCARNLQEQNLKALQHGDCLYFESVRDLGVGEDLLVWYDDLQYDIYFGIPVGYKGKSSGAEHSYSRSSLSSYPGSQPSSENSEDLFPGSAPFPAPGNQQSDTGTEDSRVGVRGKLDPLYSLFIKMPDGTRWQCKKCKRLYRQGSMWAHARIHTGERPYQCQYCGRSFCQVSMLGSHERLHTGEKPYKCEHCGRAFTQSAGLRSHFKTHRYDSQ